MLLNLSVFMWYGAVCPWASFVQNSVIPIYRLIFLSIFILLLRRLPIIFTLHKSVHQIEEARQAIFVGFFGPIGVSAVFYIYISLQFLETITVDGVQRADTEKLGETITVVVWFLAICSIVVHGLSIPLGKLGFFLPRTLSRTFPSQSNDETHSFQLQGRTQASTGGILRERKKRGGEPSGQSTPDHLGSTTTRPVYRIGGR